MRTVPATQPNRLRGLGTRLFITLEWAAVAAIAARFFVWAIQ